VADAARRGCGPELLLAEADPNLFLELAAASGRVDDSPDRNPPDLLADAAEKRASVSITKPGFTPVPRMVTPCFWASISSWRAWSG